MPPDDFAPGHVGHGRLGPQECRTAQLVDPSPRYPTLCCVVHAELTDPRSSRRRRTESKKVTSARTAVAATIPTMIGAFKERELSHGRARPRPLKCGAAQLQIRDARPESPIPPAPRSRAT